MLAKEEKRGKDGKGGRGSQLLYERGQISRPPLVVTQASTQASQNAATPFAEGLASLQQQRNQGPCRPACTTFTLDITYRQ